MRVARPTCVGVALWAPAQPPSTISGAVRESKPSLTTILAAMGSPVASAPSPSAPPPNDLSAKRNKIKVSEPTDLPFVVDGLKVGRMLVCTPCVSHFARV